MTLTLRSSAPGRTAAAHHRRAWARRLALVLLAPTAAVLAPTAPAEALLPPECVNAPNGIDIVCTFVGPAGAQWNLDVPAGATATRVRAVGEVGGSSQGVPGGRARFVEHTFSSTPGQHMRAVLPNDGGLPGGGGAGAGGGSAALFIGTSSQPLVQAAGGGGAGARASNGQPGGLGGDAHMFGGQGGGSSDPARGGGPGSSFANGAGGDGACVMFFGCAQAGAAGSFTRGGTGGSGNAGGGGGGGGWRTGGGGGAGVFDMGASGAGGGGGFSLVPFNAASSIAPLTEPRRVVITFFRARSTISPTQVVFGNVPVGSTSPQQNITVRNTGTANLSISSVSLSHPAFQKNSGCAGTTLPANGTCTIGVTFTPQSMGVFQAQLVVNSNTMEGGDSVVSLHGNGVAPVATLTPPALDFPDTLVGNRTAAQRVTMENTGTATMFIQFVELTGNDPGSFFRAFDNCQGASLPPNASCFVDVAFQPGSQGAKTAKLTFHDNAAGSPHEVSLSGLGTVAVAEVSPAQIDFGQVEVGAASGSELVTIANTGSGPLEVYSVSLEGAHIDDFGIGAHDCQGTIPAGSSCTVPVSFEPRKRGSRTAVLSVHDSAAGSPHTVALNGTGVSVGDLQVRGPGSVFTTGQGNLVTLAVSSGGTATYRIKVINTGAVARGFEIELTENQADSIPKVTTSTGAALPTNQAGNYVTKSLAPGGSIIYLVKVKNNAPGQVISGVDVHLLAGNGAEFDFVRTETNVKAPSAGTDGFGLFAKAGSQPFIGGSVNDQTTTAASVALGNSTKYTVKLRNDGATAGSMIYRMSAPANACWTMKATIKVGTQTVDITADATGNGFQTKVLPVGGSMLVTISVKRVSAGCGAVTWTAETYDGGSLQHFSHLLANPKA